MVEGRAGSEREQETKENKKRERKREREREREKARESESPEAAAFIGWRDSGTVLIGEYHSAGVRGASGLARDKAQLRMCRQGALSPTWQYQIRTCLPPSCRTDGATL